MNVIQTGFCSKLTDEFDNRMNQLNALERQLDLKIKALKVGIASITGFSPHALLKKFESDVSKGIDSMVPSLATFDDLFTLANACLFTKNDPMLSKPSTLAKSIKNRVKANANSVLTNLAAAIPTEFALSNLVNALKSQIKTSKINLIVPEATQALNCISAICGYDVTIRIARLQNFISKYNLSGTGELDVDALLSSQGLGKEAIKSINRVINQIDDVMNQIDTSFTSGVDRLKRLFPEDDDDDIDFYEPDEYEV